MTAAATTSDEASVARIDAMLRQRALRARRVGTAGWLLVLIAAAGVILTGPFAMTPADTLAALVGGGEADQRLVAQILRLPRVLAAVAAGAAFAQAGAIMQGLSRNGLADPGILGINAGASLGVVAYILASRDVAGGATGVATPYAVPVVALAGAAVAATLVYGLAWRRGGVSPTRLLLVGIAVAAAMGAAMLLLTLRLSFYTLQMVSIFQAGSVWGTTWQHVAAALPWMLALAVAGQRQAGTLDALALGDLPAAGLGVAVERQRRRLIALAVGLSAAGVALAGGVAFLGLLGPHIARRLVGGAHRRLLPTAAVVGGLLLLAADLIARLVFSPAAMPAGILVAALGAPYFLYLLTRSRA